MKRLIKEIWSDAGYGARWLTRSPGFTAAAIVTVALGVGLNAGIFTVLNGVLFRDMPAPDAHELVSISQMVEGVPEMRGQAAFSTSEYFAYRDHTQTLSGLVASAGVRGETIVGGDVPQRTIGALVSCNYLDVAQQPPRLGRGFQPQDCEQGAEPVVMLGHGLWSTAFAADPGIAGRTIELNRRRFTVVGVAAEGSNLGTYITPGFFAPLNAGRLIVPGDSRYESENVLWLDLIGRRQSSASLGQVRAEFNVIATQIDQQQPGRSTALTIERAKQVPRRRREAATGAAAVLMAAFASILLIACANVANLLLARGTARSQEIGIRLSLGASRARVARQLLTESMLISLAGGLLGSVLALSSFEALVALVVPRLMSPENPGALVWDLSPDFRVLLFATSLTLGTGILFGLAPALHASKRDVLGVIKQDTAGGTRWSGGRLRGALVGLQIALCMALMIAAGLLIRGLYTTYTVNPGFEYGNVAYISPESNLEGLSERLANEIKAQPGIDNVAFAMRAPLSGDIADSRIRLPGEGKNDSRRAELNAVSPGYFSVLGIPIVRGRTFTDAESTNARNAQAAGTRPVIVSEMTARNLWPGENPIGRTLIREEMNFQGTTLVTRDITLQVVGVAADAQMTSLGTVDPYYIYEPVGVSSLFVKTRIGFGATASSIREVARSLDPGLVVDVLPLEGNLAWWRGISSTVTALGAGLGVLALLLASVGIYGVVAYAVARRYREIGIRMALGASERNVLHMILRRTMRPVIIGALIGVAIAIALTGILSSVLFGVSPADPIGLGGAVLLVLSVALVAGMMAARPAARLDPNTVLHFE